MIHTQYELGGPTPKLVNIIISEHILDCFARLAMTTRRCCSQRRRDDMDCLYSQWRWL